MCFCKYCESSDTIKKGTLPTGAFRFECKSCGRKFRSHYRTPEQISESNRQNAKKKRKLTDRDIQTIKNLPTDYRRASVIAKRFGIHRSTAWMILKRLQ